jgi:glucose/arabinose dehydrogenase
MGGVPARLLLVFFILTGRLLYAGALHLPSSQPVLGFGFTNAFRGVRFDRPVVIASSPGETNRLFIAEKSGRIKVIDDLTQPSVSMFLDLSASTFVSEEAGLLGLAFHPKYTQNGRFFVFRISRPSSKDELIEFRRDPQNPLRADPTFQKVILSQFDGSDTHNAGDLKFGPDGYLYLSLGDEAPIYPDAHDSPQAIDKGFFAGIIRIDIDSRPENYLPNPHEAIKGEYRIPRDNPYLGVKSFNGLPVDPGKVRTEFYAVGMRNPWRFNFDPFTGALLAADVGEGAVEEINLIKKGGNYGWPYLEGTRVYREGDIPPNLEPPIYEYGHGVGLFSGRAVIGGLVYAGTDLPGLRGKYLFGDYDSGNVWALDLSAPENGPVWIAARAGTATFGIHPADGGVLVANHVEGTIDRLAYAAPNAGLPLTLREVGAFTDLRALRTDTNFIPFDVTSPLWSDGAIKQRWVDLSRVKGKVRFNESNAWTFPEGAVFLKHFELELTNGVAASRRRVETRVLVKTSDDIYGLTYRWGDSLTNAYLVPPEGTNDLFVVHDGGILRTQVWNYPTWDQCRTCHNKEAGFVLGFRTHQLNRIVERNGRMTNQLAWLAAQGLFTSKAEVQPERLRHLAALDETVAPLQFRVRSYIESNCMHCHLPGGRTAATWDARISTPLAQAHIFNERAIFYPDPMKIIASHDLENSYIYFRANNRVPLFQMPPIATTVVDDQFLEVLSKWILRIPDESWQSTDIGNSLVEGSAELYRRTLRVSSAGAGISEDSFFFCSRPAFGSTELSAQIDSFSGDSAGAEAGLMIRSSLETSAAVLVQQRGQWNFRVKADLLSAYQTIFSGPITLGSRAKLVVQGSSVSAWVADTPGNWRPFGVAEIYLDPEYSAGFAVASGGEAAQFASAEFDEMQLHSLDLALSASEIYVPQPVTLTARISSFGEEISTIQFRNGGDQIGTVSSIPWALTWTNVPEGNFKPTATLQGSGIILTSAPIALQASAPNPYVWVRPLDRRTLENWSLRYGQVAYLIPGLTNLESDLVKLQVLRGEITVIEPSTNLFSLESNPIGIASELHASNRVEISFRSSDFGTHQGTLYFRDWLNAGKSQLVEFINPRDNSLLGRKLVNAQTPVYLPFVFRNEVLVRVRNPAGQSYVTAVFVDSVPPVSVDIASPEDGMELRQPASLPVTVNASAPGRELRKIELWDGRKLVASVTNSPLQTAMTNLLAGDHVLRAIAYGTFGVTNESDPVTVRVLPVSSAATFVGVDSLTQGSWKGRYGQDGLWMPGDETILPDVAQISSPDGAYYLFVPSGSELRALERAYSQDRFVACLFGSPEFSVVVNLVDGQPCTAGLYFLDWDGHRAVNISVESPDGTVLDQREVTDFNNGKYFFWRVQGPVRFRLSSKWINAVVSGIFLNRSLPPFELWRNNTFTPAEVLAAGANFGSADFDGDGFSNALEYYLGYDARSAQDKPRFSYDAHGGWFEMNFSDRSEIPNMTFKVESSTDLSHWTAITPIAITQKAADGERVSWSFPMEGRTRFIRYSLVDK